MFDNASSSHSSPSPAKDTEFVERLLRLSADYVQPSDDLRPRIVEAAREVDSAKRSQRLLGQMFLTMAVLFWGTVLCLPIATAVREAKSAQLKSIENRAQDLFQSHTTDIQSATQLAYEEWRNSLQLGGK